MAKYHILNLGAGVQSTALFLLAHQGEITIDVAIFADTQEEPKAVYDHLQNLQAMEYPRIIVCTIGKLGDHLVSGRNKRSASIPAYTAKHSEQRCRSKSPRPADDYSIVTRQCTKEYKIEPIEREIRRTVLGLKPRQRIPKDVQIYQYFGISIDESKRADRILKNHAKNKWSTPVFPLIERGWDRADCKRFLREQLAYEVPRSSCVFCPYHSNREWKHLKTTDQESWQRAVEIDRALRIAGNVVNRNMEQNMYLHRSCIPLEIVDFDDGLSLFPDERDCQGMCGN